MQTVSSVSSLVCSSLLDIVLAKLREVIMAPMSGDAGQGECVWWSLLGPASVGVRYLGDLAIDVTCMSLLVGVSVVTIATGPVKGVLVSC